MNLEIITLEDNITYAITFEKEGYVYLTNINNPKDFCIRKVVKRDGEEFIESLESDEEYKKALKLFIK